MRLIIVFVIIILVGVTWYLLRAQKELLKGAPPLLAEADRPKVDYNSFMEGLEKGDISQKYFADILEVLSSYIYGEQNTLHAIIVALLSQGHILIQGNPGTGKTTIARLLAGLGNLSYSRIQCTPDLLPQDVLGGEIFDAKKQDFTFLTGPIFANILHVDEINRATPKMQSAFLEAMQEYAITVGGHHIKLPSPFFMIATQNPFDTIGTYMLPYGQIDRFMVGVYATSLDQTGEYRLLSQSTTGQMNIEVSNYQEALSVAALENAQGAIKSITVSENVLHHAIACVHTPKMYGIPLSTRATKSLISAAKTWAWLQGKRMVDKADIDALLPIILQHRIEHALGQTLPREAIYRIITGAAQKDDVATL